MILPYPLFLHQIGGELPKAFAEDVAFDDVGFRPDVRDLKKRCTVRRALVHTDASITAIAFDCVFGNLSNFNRQFKTIKGTTPRAFRQADGAGST